MTCELIDFQWHPPIVPAGAVQSDPQGNPPSSHFPHTVRGFKRMDVWMDRQTDRRMDRHLFIAPLPCMALALYWTAVVRCRK